MDDINARIDQYAAQELERLNSERNEAPEEDSAAMGQPIDLYQAKRNDRYEKSGRASSYGSPKTLNTIAQQMADTIVPQYNVAVNQFNHLQEYGMNDDAQAFADDYMENDFIPVVMGLVDQYGADSILKNQRVLDTLDAKALTGNGDGAGYTAAFIRTMAPEVQGTVASVSDIELEDRINDLKEMNTDDPRGAISMAVSLKERVDNGELSASADDYQFLTRVAASK